MMNSGKPEFRIAVVAALLAVALAACADMQWHRAGAKPEERQQDLEQCRQQARLQSAQWTWPAGSMPQVIGVDRQGRAVAGQPYSRDNERFLVEHDYVRHCMRQKGYELVPERPASARN